MVPQGGDQAYWAGRVAELGIGAAHDGPTPTEHSLSTALRIVLTPDTRARASALAAEMGTRGATTAAHLLIGTGIVLVGIALVQRRTPAPVS